MATSEVPADPSQNLLETKMNSYWTYEIICIEGDRKRSLVIAPATTLAEAMAGAFKDATYYIGVCGYKITLAFEERCKACDGTGRIIRRTKRTCKALACKACKGHPVIQAIAETPWLPSEAVKIEEASNESRR
jgi:hypothetical protein